MFKRTGLLALFLLLGACQTPNIIVNDANMASRDAAGKILVDAAAEQKYPAIYRFAAFPYAESADDKRLNVRVALLDRGLGEVLYDAPTSTDGEFAVSLPRQQVKREIRALFFAFVDNNQNRRFDHGEPRSDNQYELLWEGDKPIAQISGWSRVEVLPGPDGHLIEGLSPLSTLYEFKFK